MQVILRELAEGAVLAEYPGVSRSQANAAAVAGAAALREAAPAGLLDAIPAACSLLVLFEPPALGLGALESALTRALSAPPGGPPREVVIPVRYGGEGGPDLEDLARERGLTPEGFARRHFGARYRVAFLGFSPGFPYLEGLPEQLHAPRLSTPRPRVPAGAVGLAGHYCGIYPEPTPGGWRLIGRTPLRLFSPGAEPPTLLSPGDQVRFEAIDDSAFASLSRPEPPSAPRGSPLFRVRSPGLFTSVQGGPRFGLGRFGIPPGGAMDLPALRRGNGLLGNALDAPALEVTLVGPELELLAPARLCLSGAPVDAALEGRTVSIDEPFEARAGEVLSLGRARRGARAYLCVEGGIADPGVRGGPLRAGAVLALGEAASGTRGPIPAPGKIPKVITLRVLPGPQRERFRPSAWEALIGAEFRVSARSDRRGVRLEGPRLLHLGPADILPEGNAPGAVQVPGDGQPIVLGPDRPVTGGYAKIATVIGADLPLLAQARPGGEVRFEEVIRGDACGST